MKHKVCGGIIIEVHLNFKKDGPPIGGLYVCTQCQNIVHMGEIEGETVQEFHVKEAINGNN